MFNFATENIILPISDIILGQQISKDLSFLLKSQWWSKDQLIEFQERKLKLLVKHCFETVPYYQEYSKKEGLHYQDIQSIEDLKLLPILTKDKLREHDLGYFMSKNIDKNKLLKKCSSGSTGEPFCHYITKRSNSFFKAVKLRGWYINGYRIGDKFIKIDNSKANKIKSLQDFVTRNKSIYVKDINKDSIEEIVHSINKYSPKVLRAYPTPLLMLITMAENKGLTFKEIPFVATTGSILYPEFRSKIQTTFGASVIDAYSNEGGANAFECNTHDCYHSAMEYAITEVINDNGNPVRKGRAIGTDLWNYAFPFLRYDSQDIVEVSDNKCSCGRELLAIKKIWGRDTEVLMTPEGNMVVPHMISKALSRFKEIDQYQLRQNNIDHFELFVVTKLNNKNNLSRELENVLKELLSDNIVLSLRYVTEIPLLPSGKRRYIYRNPSVNLNNVSH